MNKIEKFQRNYNLFFVVLFVNGFVILLTIFEDGWSDYLFNGILIFLGLLAFIYLVVYFTTVTIYNDESLVYKVPLEFGFNINISDITKIERVPLFVFKSWGCGLEFQCGENKYRIKESNYSVKTIKNLIVRLQEINPSIKLHHQYKTLLDGGFEREDDFKDILLEEDNNIK